MTTIDDILRTMETVNPKDALQYGKKGMQWGVVNEEDGASRPSGTRALELTAAENRADPDGPDRRAQIKKAALIAGGAALVGAAGYGAYRLHKSGALKGVAESAVEAKKVLQAPTDIIHLARAKNAGLKFHSMGNTPDYFGIFDKAGLNGDVAKNFFEKQTEGYIAARFVDPLNRIDFAGRPIGHDVIIPKNMSANINSTEDVIEKIWPKIRDGYQKYWDDSLVSKLNHQDQDGGSMSFIDNILSAMESKTADDAVQFGVKGMRWGVSKPAGSGPGPASEVSVKTKPGKKVKTSGGKERPASEDAIKAAVGKQIAKKSSTDALSNQELQAVVNRMQLEAKYSQLSKQNVGAGRKFLKQYLTNPQTRRGISDNINDYEVTKQYKIGKQVGDAIKKTDLSTIGN